jgi:hypothetical protein
MFSFALSHFSSNFTILTTSSLEVVSSATLQSCQPALSGKRLAKKNGARTEEEMRARVARYRRIPNPNIADDFDIGCILLESPFFFKTADWITMAFANTPLPV